MNNKMLPIAALAAVLVAGVFATTPMAAYAGGDSSETKTEQSIKQKNSGSDASTNVNCGDNDINSASDIEAQVCGTLDVSVLEAVAVLRD
jgi:phage-related minor tail protein